MNRWKKGLVMAAGVLVVAWTAFWWLPALFGLAGRHGDEIQAIGSLVEIVGTILGVGLGLWAWLRRKPAPDADPPGSSEEEQERATAGYLGHLRDRYVYLEHKGLGLSHRVGFKLPLLELYVPLSARPSMPEGEAWDRRATVAGRVVDPAQQETMARRLGEPKRVLALLREHDGLVVLGDPGSGKSTLLKYLAVAMASGREDELGIGRRLPILIPLADYASAMTKSPDGLRFDDFVGSYVRNMGGDEAVGAALASALEQGRALLLFDGLDEVRDPQRRQQVAKSVADFFSFHRGAGNKFVMTSRIVGYREVQPMADGLVECTLVDFDDAAIEAFVTRFTATVEGQASDDAKLAKAKAEDERTALLEAVRGNAGVRKLAANPLMLTILALMKRQGISLPDRRVELYDRYVKTLLSSWNQARSLSYQHVPPDVDATETERLLAPLARWMHTEHAGLGMVERPALKRWLKDRFKAAGDEHPRQHVERFLTDVHDHTGILIDRGGDRYGFIHLTFEEYLAAAGIALEAEGDVEALFEALAPHVGDPAWRESAQLLVGYVGIVQKMPGRASELLERLIRESPGPPGAAVILAGAAALDVGSTGIRADAKQRVIAALVKTLHEKGVDLASRFGAGDLLGRLGDPRPGVGTVTIKRGAREQELPDIDWVEVPAGPFQMGSAGDDELADAHEKPQHELDLPRFWIARYPVTHAQFRPFVEARGYRDEQWWGEHGWAWRDGRDSDLGKLIPEEHRSAWRDHYALRPAEKRHQPFWWRDRRLGLPTRPVVGVCWYEVMAFARWLAAQQGTDLPGGTPAGYVVRLPSEAEWEKAARGSDPRRWPWGDAFREDACNHRGLELGETSVVGLFGEGGAFGARDMAGNVWEWTTSAWGEMPLEAPRFGYPYDPSDGREDPALLAARVVRSGSWYSDKKYVRCAFRDRDLPDYWLNDIGFRLVFSLAEL